MTGKVKVEVGQKLVGKYGWDDAEVIQLLSDRLCVIHTPTAIGEKMRLLGTDPWPDDRFHRPGRVDYVVHTFVLPVGKGRDRDMHVQLSSGGRWRYTGEVNWCDSPWAAEIVKALDNQVKV